MLILLEKFKVTVVMVLKHDLNMIK